MILSESQRLERMIAIVKERDLLFRIRTEYQLSDMNKEIQFHTEYIRLTEEILTLIDKNSPNYELLAQATNNTIIASSKKISEITKLKREKTNEFNV